MCDLDLATPAHAPTYDYSLELRSAAQRALFRARQATSHVEDYVEYVMYLPGLEKSRGGSNVFLSSAALPHALSSAALPRFF